MAPFNCYKCFRGLRSICAPITATIGFTLMLTYVFVLYQPSRGPGIKQKMGWQSWEVITTSNGSGETHAPSPSSNTSTDGGVDWWNVTAPEDKVDFSSLPLDVWSPLLPHNTGCESSLISLRLDSDQNLVSEITVVHCLIDPGYGTDLCTPESTSEQDAIKGKWVRVPRNLNLEGGYMAGWLVCRSFPG